MPVQLTSIDSVPLEADDLSDDLKMWLRNLVGILNTDIELIQGELLSLDARVTALGG